MTEQQPLVSIVIPCYNHAQFVQETIQSVIDQDYQNIELIIIDDGSKDNSVEKIQEMISVCEKRFKRFEFRHRPNKGLCATLNEALEWCEGEYFAPVASDDLIKPYKTTIQVDFLLRNPSFIGAFGSAELLSKGRTKQKVKRKYAEYDFNDIFLHKHYLPACTQLLRLSRVKEINGFKEHLIIEDWSMWLFLTDNGGKLVCLNEVFASYRRHDSNISADLDIMLRGRLQIINIFKDKELYTLAKANVMLVQGRDTLNTRKKGSIKFILKAIVINPRCILTKSFLSYFVNIFFKNPL